MENTTYYIIGNWISTLANQGFPLSWSLYLSTSSWCRQNNCLLVDRADMKLTLTFHLSYIHRRGVQSEQVMVSDHCHYSTSNDHIMALLQVFYLSLDDSPGSITNHWLTQSIYTRCKLQFDGIFYNLWVNKEFMYSKLTCCRWPGIWVIFWLCAFCGQHYSSLLVVP
jgi:hypothetical protein